MMLVDSRNSFSKSIGGFIGYLLVLLLVPGNCGRWKGLLDEAVTD